MQYHHKQESENLEKYEYTSLWDGGMIPHFIFVMFLTGYVHRFCRVKKEFGLMAHKD